MTNRELAEIAAQDISRGGADTKDDWVEEAAVWVQQAKDYIDEVSGNSLKLDQHSRKLGEAAIIEYVKARLQGRLPQSTETFNLALNQWQKRARKAVYDQRVAEDETTWKISTERSMPNDEHNLFDDNNN